MADEMPGEAPAPIHFAKTVKSTLATAPSRSRLSQDLHVLKALPSHDRQGVVGSADTPPKRLSARQGVKRRRLPFTDIQKGVIWCFWGGGPGGVFFGQKKKKGPNSQKIPQRF